VNKRETISVAIACRLMSYNHICKFC